jgi:hypothetical protein
MEDCCFQQVFYFLRDSNRFASRKISVLGPVVQSWVSLTLG